MINIIVLLFQKENAGFNKITILNGILFGIISVIGNYAIGRSLEGVNPGLIVVILRSQVIWVILMGILFLKEKVNGSFMIGCAIAFIGFYILNNEKIKGGIGLESILWGLLAAISFSFIQIVIKLIIHKINPISMNLIRLISGLMIILCLPSFWEHTLSLNFSHWWLAFLAAFFGPSLSRNLQMYSMMYIPVSQFILFTMITPVVTILLAWMIWEDIPGNMSLIGGMIILMGVSLPVLDNIYANNRNEKKA